MTKRFICIFFGSLSRFKWNLTFHSIIFFSNRAMWLRCRANSTSNSRGWKWKMPSLTWTKSSSNLVTSLRSTMISWISWRNSNLRGARALFSVFFSLELSDFVFGACKNSQNYIGGSHLEYCKLYLFICRSTHNNESAALQTKTYVCSL